MSKLMAVFAGGFLVAHLALFSQAEEGSGAGIVCPVSGKAVNKDCTVDYKGGKVAFCCGNCAASFTKDSSKFAAKANHQLVASKQAKLVKCPFSGGKLNPETAIDVAGVKVCFCCDRCKAKAESAEDRVTLLFNDAAFAKGFEVKKAE
jgi:YHS domain-containing protein